MVSPAIERASVVPELSRIDRNCRFFVQPSQEADYCKDNNFILERFSNGATMLIAPLIVQGKVSASVEMDFPSGAVLDPPGKSGTLHMLEHVASFEPNNFARSKNNKANASTSPTYLRFSYAGIANPNVREVGLWPVFPLVFRVLHHPERLSDRIDERLAAERGNVGSEMDRFFLDQEHMAELFIQKVTLAPDNPTLKRAFGNHEEVARITADDIIQSALQTIIPHGMVISALTREYDVPVQRELAATLRPYIEAFPRADARPRPIDRSAFEHVNPQFTPGDVYINDTGLENREATVSYVWVVQTEQFSTLDSVLHGILGIVHDNLHEVVRSNGLSYVTRAVSVTPGESTTICCINISLYRHQNPVEFALDKREKILSGVFDPITDGYIDQTLQEEADQRRAIPKSMEGRFDTAEYGLQRYGRMLNFDVLYDHLAGRTPEDYQYWLNYFRSVPPAVIVTGDLSRVNKD